MFATVDLIRKEVTSKLDRTRQSELGQFLTPRSIAGFMASLFSDRQSDEVHILDAGAGVGSLLSAFLERKAEGFGSFTEIKAKAYEIDKEIISTLINNLLGYEAFASTLNFSFEAEVKTVDFIQDTVFQVLSGESVTFDYAILNPPYKKINKQSSYRSLLSQVGLETVNLYTGFVALALLSLKPEGELVAIVPRSFCNGPYYRAFRELILKKAAIKQIHLFESRSKAFKDDKVLQENIIIHLQRSALQGDVLISSSSDSGFEDLQQQPFPFTEIVRPDDAEQMFHIPSPAKQSSLYLPRAFQHTLKELNLQVSTGPVVDFRVREHLREQPDETTVPLLYPGHFATKYTNWPKEAFKKPNAIALNQHTIKALYPKGYYTIVKRFSSKEEKRRIVARIIDPEVLPGNYYGFENHLNIFHSKKNGLTEAIALGLGVYLNSSIVDAYFRQFNGHTQVNATDLRLLTYPNLSTLHDLGTWALTLDTFDQDKIDNKVATLV